MKCILIVDRPGYEIFDSKIIDLVSAKYEKVQIIHTSYETDKIRRARKLPHAGNALMHLLRWKLSFDFARQIYSNSKDAVVISLNPLVGSLLGLFRKNWNQLIVCGFLFEKKDNKLYYWLRKKIALKSLNNIDKAVVYGSKEVDYYERELQIKDKFHFVPYGIEYLNQKKYHGVLPLDFIFSGGGSNRDYKTLIDAYKRYSDSINEPNPLVIATQPWRLTNIDLPVNSQLLEDVVNETFGDVLGKCKVLVLSLKEGKISAGHMVMLQAMAEKVPILVNDIPAIRDYADSRMVTFYNSGDVQDLCENLEKLQSISLNRQKVEFAYRKYQKHYTFIPFVERLVDMSLKITKSA